MISCTHVPVHKAEHNGGGDEAGMEVVVLADDDDPKEQKDDAVAGGGRRLDRVLSRIAETDSDVDRAAHVPHQEVPRKKRSAGLTIIELATVIGPCQFLPLNRC